MPLSKKILRGNSNNDLEKANLSHIGPVVKNPVEKLYKSLPHHVPKPAKVELTDEQKALLAWEKKLKHRETQITALEQHTIEQATQIGQQRGYEAGWEKAEHERITLKQAAETLHEEFEAFKTQLAEKILDLACLIARQTLNEMIESNSELAILTFRKLFDSMELTPEKITLLAHPHTLEILKNQFGQDTELQSIRLRPDPNQMKGGFILKHPEGEIDANMQTRWQKVIQQLDRKLPLSITNHEATQATQSESIPTHLGQSHASLD